MAETAAQHQARLRAEALNAFYAKQADRGRSTGIRNMGGVVTEGRPPKQDTRSAYQRILDALSGRP